MDMCDAKCDSSQDSVTACDASLTEECLIKKTYVCIYLAEV
jgi:hypothetical protein